MNLPAFIAANMRLEPAPLLPEIRLYAAHPATGLGRLDALVGQGGAPPYWAYPWAGGAALARHFLDRPDTVRGRRVLDLGAGSGLVGIAAAKAGARGVIASELDRNAVAALGMNAAANNVSITIIPGDLTAGEPPAVDLVAVGDLFYESALAIRVTAFLDRCLAAGMEVLVGDPGRVHLPYPRLRLIAEYAVGDFGGHKTDLPAASRVFAFEPLPSGDRVATKAASR